MGVSWFNKRATGLATVLLLQTLPHVKAGNVCGSMSCFDDSDNVVVIPESRYDGIQCVNSWAPTNKEGWSIWKTDQIPTVEEIQADMELCGIVTAADRTTIFYSFGGGLTNAKLFAEQHLATQDPPIKGININDVLPDSWYDALKEKHAFAMSTSYGPGQQAFSARNSQALARASKGRVYMVGHQGDGTNGVESPNVYTVPFASDKPEFAWKGQHNTWYDFEFGALQDNPDITEIISVVVMNDDAAGDHLFEINENPGESWVRGRGDPAANVNINANTWTKQYVEDAMAAFQNNPNIGFDVGTPATTPAKKRTIRKEVQF